VHQRLGPVVIPVEKVFTPTENRSAGGREEHPQRPDRQTDHQSRDHDGQKNDIPHEHLLVSVLSGETVKNI
jgi:hypothetical protein